MISKIMVIINIGILASILALAVFEDRYDLAESSRGFGNWESDQEESSIAKQRVKMSIYVTVFLLVVSSVAAIPFILETGNILVSILIVVVNVVIIDYYLLKMERIGPYRPEFVEHSRILAWVNRQVISVLRYFRNKTIGYDRKRRLQKAFSILSSYKLV